MAHPVLGPIAASYGLRRTLVFLSFKKSSLTHILLTTKNQIDGTKGNSPDNMVLRVFLQEVIYIKEWMVYPKVIACIVIHCLLIYLSARFNEGMPCSTINSTKCLVSTILHIPIYLSKTKHPLVVKNIAEIFNLRLPKPELNNVWNLDILVRYLKGLRR